MRANKKLRKRVFRIAEQTNPLIKIRGCKCNYYGELWRIMANSFQIINQNNFLEFHNFFGEKVENEGGNVFEILESWPKMNFLFIYYFHVHNFFSWFRFSQKYTIFTIFISVFFLNFISTENALCSLLVASGIHEKSF